MSMDEWKLSTGSTVPQVYVILVLVVRVLLIAMNRSSTTSAAALSEILIEKQLHFVSRSYYDMHGSAVNQGQWLLTCCERALYSRLEHWVERALLVL